MSTWVYNDGAVDQVLTGFNPHLSSGLATMYPDAVYFEAELTTGVDDGMVERAAAALYSSMMSNQSPNWDGSRRIPAEQRPLRREELRRHEDGKVLWRRRARLMLEAAL